MSFANAAAAELLEAFRALDTQRVGWVPTLTLKNLLERFGDFSTSEKEEFIAEADQGGRIYYERFVKEVLFDGIR
ncbi:hypothetical protein TcBrA4_0129580 [Trypanosoma cruzi]|nr:hypothetical protein TcBrA4_0129580 [Trypanosoma cruzi]